MKGEVHLAVPSSHFPSYPLETVVGQALKTPSFTLSM